MKEFFVSIYLIPASHILDMYECLGFGGEEDDVLLNHCLLLARYYIHCCKFKNVSPCIREYVQQLKFNFEIEKQVFFNGDRFREQISAEMVQNSPGTIRSGFLHNFNLLLFFNPKPIFA